MGKLMMMGGRQQDFSVRRFVAAAMVFLGVLLVVDR
jgi:hypothetical protein